MGRFFTKCIRENIQIATLAITVEEYLVFPYSSGKTEYRDNFIKFLEYMHIEVIHIDCEIAETGRKSEENIRALKRWMPCRLQPL